MPTPDAARLIGRRWSRRDFARPSPALARALLGMLLVRRLDSGELLAGRIVETEAYCGVKDRAAHSFGGRRTPRNQAMYSRPGTAYVYFTYGLHHCVNVVCGAEGEPVAVLLRALEPVLGLASMTRFRAATTAGKSPIPLRRLCRGPACICQAMGLTLEHNGLDLAADTRLWIADPAGLPRVHSRSVVRTPRIGVDYAGDWASRPLRWAIADHPCVSGPRTRRE